MRRSSHRARCLAYLAIFGGSWAIGCDKASDAKVMKGPMSFRVDVVSGDLGSPMAPRPFSAEAVEFGRQGDGPSVRADHQKPGRA